VTTLAGRRIVLGVTGGIAAYKAVEVCRRLVDAGAHVSPVLTDGAQRMVGATTFSALASEPVRTELWDDPETPIPHTKMGQAADLILVCPATARLISDLRTGRSADLLMATILASRAPVMICPAMHTEMWEQASVQENLDILADRGVLIVPPESGRLAGGDLGQGRLAEPSTVVAAVEVALTDGDLAGRTRLLRTVIEGIRTRVPRLGVAVRLSVFDLVPHVPGEGGVGVPETDDPPFAFGGDGTGLGYDLTETHAVLEQLAGLGVGLISVTAASPYYAPHAQRLAYFPPSDGYQPPEDPLVGVARILAATRELNAAHPSMRFVGGGMSYVQDWFAHVGEALVADGWVDSVGLGRMVLSYPHLPADVAAGRLLERRLICRTFSDCTTAPRGGLVSGCYPLDDFYNEREERVQLAAYKKELRQRLR